MDYIILNMTMKNEGFEGQRLVVMPESTLFQCEQHPVIQVLHLTHMGYFPRVKDHAVDRLVPIDTHILIYCHRGQGWCKLHGHPRQSIKDGQFFIIPQGIPHSYGSETNASWEISWVHFKGNHAKDIIDQLSLAHYGSPITATAPGEAFQIFTHILAELERGINLDSCIQASMKIWSFFAELIHQQQAHTGSQNAISVVIDVMHDTIGQSLSLEDLSHKVDLSPAYLCRTFKDKMGQSPMDYFIRLKIQHACRYLDLTDLKIHDIAKKVGYEDPYYFSRIFKKIMACSPRDYRKQFKG
jgi:AraC-like DNA-binding protein